MAAMARRLLLRTPPLHDSFVLNSQRSGVLVNGTLAQDYKSRHSAFPAIGLHRRELHGLAIATSGDESRSVGFAATLITRSFATRSTQLRRLAKQPAKRDGSDKPYKSSQSSSRRMREIGTTGDTRRRGNFQKREGSGSHSNLDPPAWDAKRSNPRHLDGATAERSRRFVNSGPRLDRSSVMRPRSFQELQLRRRGLQDVEAEGELPCADLV